MSDRPRDRATDSVTDGPGPWEALASKKKSEIFGVGAKVKPNSSIVWKIEIDTFFLNCYTHPAHCFILLVMGLYQRLFKGVWWVFRAYIWTHKSNSWSTQKHFKDILKIVRVIAISLKQDKGEARDVYFSSWSIFLPNRAQPGSIFPPFPFFVRFMHILTLYLALNRLIMHQKHKQSLSL